MNRHGLSLLEVILATAILLAATVTLGRLAFVTTQHAQRAEDRAVAIEIAEFQLQQLLLGQLPVQSVGRGPVLPETAALEGQQASMHPWDEWHFALQVTATDLPTVQRVQVDVFRLRPDAFGAGSAGGSASSYRLGAANASGGPSGAMSGNAVGGGPPLGGSDAVSPGAGVAARADDVLFQYSVVRLLHLSR